MSLGLIAAGGGGGIRTRERFNPLHDFQSCALGRTMRPLLAQGSVPHKGGGEGGIRTRGACNSTLLFESSTLNHSDTSPREIVPVWRGLCHCRSVPGHRFTDDDRPGFGIDGHLQPVSRRVFSAEWTSSMLFTIGIAQRATKYLSNW